MYDDEGQEQIPMTFKQIAWQLDVGVSVAKWIESLGIIPVSDSRGVITDWNVKDDAMITKKDGISMIMHFINTTLSKETGSSALHEDEIRALNRDALDTLAINLGLEGTKYGIVSESDKNEILAGARRMTITHMNKSRQGFMVKQLNENRVVRIDESPKEEKRRGISSLIPKRRRKENE